MFDQFFKELQKGESVTLAMCIAPYSQFKKAQALTIFAVITVVAALPDGCGCG